MEITNEYVIERLTNALKIMQKHKSKVEGLSSKLEDTKRDFERYLDKKHATERMDSVVSKVNAELHTCKVPNSYYTETNGIKLYSICTIERLQEIENMCINARNTINSLKKGVEMHDDAAKNINKYSVALKKVHDTIEAETGCSVHVSETLCSILETAIKSGVTMHGSFAIPNEPLFAYKNTPKYYCEKPIFTGSTIVAYEVKYLPPIRYWYFPIMQFREDGSFSIKIAAIDCTTSDGSKYKMRINLLEMQNDNETATTYKLSPQNGNEYKGYYRKITPFPGDAYIAAKTTTVIPYNEILREFIIEVIDEMIELEVPEFTK